MRIKRNCLMKALSIMLVFSLLLGSVPNQVIALSGEAMLSEINADDTATLQAEREYLGTERIVEEDMSKRGESYKEYILNNGLRLATVYPSAIHYEKDGEWKEIDNTLIAVISNGNAVYTNTAGKWNVRFPQNLSGNSMIGITKDGYTFRFGLAGELRSTGGVVVASADQAAGNIGTDTLTVTAAQATSAQIQEVDLSAALAAAEYQETVLSNLHSRLSYANVYPNTNVVYDLQGNQLKESIILQKYDESLWGYRYTLDTGDLVPVLNDNQQIDLCDPVTKEVIMTMPAPYLVDDNGVYNYDVNVRLTQNGDNYLLSYYLPRAWLADTERAWPVVLDPIISADGSYSNMRDRTIAETVEEAYNLGSIRCGYHEDYGRMWIFMQYVALPAITSADVVVEATITLRKLETGSDSAVVEVHKVNGTWDSETITWTNKPGHDETVEDYAVCQTAGSYTWTITDIVREWYASANTGMMFKISDKEEAMQVDNWKQFASSDYDSTSVTTMPMLNIKFRNANGLEDYWDYTSSSAGRAGTGYINNYNGNLVWVRNDIGFSGNRMPVSISHVYNANDSQNNSFGMGYGWRTNYNQRVYQWSENANYYIWEDGDGTLHYFYKTSTGNYADEDGLYLTLTTTGSGDSTYKLTDQFGNCSHFNADGRLVKIENNQQTKSSITITYKSAAPHLIDTITDGANRKYYFTYTNYLLTRISYKSTGSSEISYVTFSYSSSKLTRITDKDGKYSTYTYGGRNLLLSAQDVDGYKLTYTYNLIDTAALLQPSRVGTITESNSAGTAGGRIRFEYANNQTTLTDHNGNKQIIQFNNWGNAVAIMDGEGHGQFVTYRIPENSTQKGNQMDLSSKLQNTVGNMLNDNSFERGLTWTNLSGVTHSIVTGTAYSGNRSLKMTRSSAGAASGVKSSAIIPEAGKSYTFSAYVKTGAGATAYLAIYDASGNYQASETLPANSDWTRLEVTFTTVSTASIYVQLMTETAGTVYMDCVQLEKSPTASRYNLLENGDFRYISMVWSSSTTAISTEDLRTSVTSTAAPQLNNYAYQLTGKPRSTLYLKQTVAVSGIAGDTFVLTGWAKGDSAPLNVEGRTFGLRGVFTYTDGTSQEFSFSFNPDTDSSVNWQYTAGVMTAAKPYSKIDVYIDYSYNVNTVLFDGIQLYKEEYGYSYEYDSNGNVVEARDLQGGTTSYTYVSNNLTKVEYPDGTYINYTYDSYHNLKTATTNTGVTYTYTYDAFGNNLSVSIGSGSTTITSSAEYTNNGNFLKEATDTAGNKTVYNYNADTGVLDSVQYPKENGDNSVSQTTYTYDTMYRLLTTKSTVYTGSNLTASYTYNSYDQLTKLQTASTAYDFTYDSFGLRSSIKIGSRVLAQYTYDSQDHTLTTLDFGNQNRIKYTYDTQGRVIRADYYPNRTSATIAGYITYDYDNNGALATVYDSATGRTTTYYYDDINRLVRYVESSGGDTHSVRYRYDELDYLTEMTEVIGTLTRSTFYTYDNDNRISTITSGTNVLTYGYDAYGRQTTLRFDVGGSTLMTRRLTYRTANNNPTSQVSNLFYTGANLNLSYTYDENGNITSISDGTYTTSYEYDAANQLTRENNQAAGKTWVWTYDTAGNILSKAEYAYTIGTVGTASNPVIYTYGDTAWGDLLTAYNGVAISYDANGNPLYDGTWTYTWEWGRQLKSMSGGGSTWSFTYDAEGMRTRRSNGTTTYTYVYNGSSLSKMTVGSNTLYFTYDASGSPATVTYNNVLYYYVTNLQGDVVAIINGFGTEVVHYSYDAWGKLLTTTGNMAATLGTYNPLRYRGYVYDQELGLYYLQSRYYDPELCRFLNADAFVSTGQGELGNNMFAYCGNNPIIFVDNTGTYYTSGQIHNFVVEDICKNNPNKHGKNTYMTYKEPYQKGNRYYLYGYCDVFDMSTHEIWEVKRYGGGSSCSVAAASRQLRNYVKNGILSYYAPWEQHIGGTFTTIEMNTFHKRDNDGSGTYVISYWDAGGGIVFYDYYYLPGPEELLMLLECAVVVAAVGAGAMCCYICIDIAFNPHRRW